MLAVVLVALLGHEDYRTREAADAMLRAIGPGAYPALRAALTDESPEVRHRADRLLAPSRGPGERARILAWLDSPWPPSPGDVCRLYSDAPTRQSICRELEARKCKVKDYAYAYLDPRTKPPGDWPVWFFGRSLEAARRDFGSPRPWMYPAYPP